MILFVVWKAKYVVQSGLKNFKKFFFNDQRLKWNMSKKEKYFSNLFNKRVEELTELFLKIFPPTFQFHLCSDKLFWSSCNISFFFF